MIRGLGCAIALLMLSLPRLAGQFTAGSPSFAQLHDSLAAIRDTAGLRSLWRAISRSDEPAQIRRGLIALRMGELKADPDFDKARSSFRRAAELWPGRPEPWYGLGLAEAGRSEWEMRDRMRLGSRVGLKALERAGVYHARALAADPAFTPAAVALAQVELALMDTVRIRQARELVRRSAGAGARSSEFLLAWGRLERAAGSLDSAGLAFERHLLTTEHRGLGLLELARSRLAAGRADGEAPYYEGASDDDPVAMAEYRADLALVAGVSELAELDCLRGPARAGFLHEFWTDRDHLELRPEGSRLREHYRRLQYARAHFPLTISRRFYGRVDAYRSGNDELDDRGIIYIRQGEPAERLRPFVFGLMPNESWRYRRAEGDLLLHFSAGYDSHGGGDLYDYRLVQSVLDLRGAGDAPRDQLILSRQSLSPVYSRMLNWGRFGSANAEARERNIGTTSIEVGTTTDSYELQFRRRLGAVADLVAVGRTERGTLGHLVFGIVAAGTAARQVADGFEYRVRVRIAALDGKDHAVATLDTSFVIQKGRALAKGEYLVGRAEIPLPPGRWGYRAALEQGGNAGVVLPRGTVRVALADGTALSVSDIALGTPGRAIPWITEVGDTVLLAPSALFREGADVELYYEASGAVTGALYRHEIAVFRADPRGEVAQQRPLVSLRFDEAAVGEIIRSHRRLRLDRLPRGEYEVEVRVMGPDGRGQIRRRAIRIISP